MFGEIVDAKYVKSSVRVPKAEPQWFTGIQLGEDTDADESIFGTAEGVFKTRSLKRKPPSQQWNVGAQVEQ